MTLGLLSFGPVSGGAVSGSPLPPTPASTGGNALRRYIQTSFYESPDRLNAYLLQQRFLDDERRYVMAQIEEDDDEILPFIDP